MSPLILGAVLFAALLHAVWNALIKVSGDRLVVMSVTTATSALLVVPLLLILPPPAPESWPYLGMSALIHSSYMLLLIRAYSHGDFAQVYPLSRGSAPLLTALLGFVLLGEAMTERELLGSAIDRCRDSGTGTGTQRRQTQPQPGSIDLFAADWIEHRCLCPD